MCWKLVKLLTSQLLDSSENFVLAPFLAKFEWLKVGIDQVVSELLKDDLYFLLLFELQLYKTEIGMVKNVNEA